MIGYLAFAMVGVAGQSADARCSSIGTNDMVECAAAANKASDAELNRQWRLTLAKIRARDGEFDKSDRNANGGITYSAALVSAQRAWLAYRDAECRTQVYANVGGRELSIYSFGCLTTLNRERTKALKELAERN